MALGMGLGLVKDTGILASSTPADPSKFRYTLATDMYTSAAVYDGDDVLIRHLWDWEREVSGNHVKEWDELDMYGNPVTGVYGVDWVIKILKSDLQAEWQGARVGNTSTVTTGRHVLRSFSPMCTATLDNNIMTIGCGYAEGISSAHQILYDNKGEKYNDLLDGVFGENGQETQWMWSDGTIVYFGGLDPYNIVASWVYGVSLYDTAEYDFGTTFTDSYTCSIGRTYSWCIALMTSSTTEQITGLAGNDSYLYIARGGIDTIQICDKLTGEILVTNTDYTNPRALSINGNKLVMITDTDSCDTYTLSGTTITLDVTLTGLTHPLNTAATPKYINYLQETNSAISGYDMLDTWRPIGSQTTVSATTTTLGTEHLLKAFNTPSIGLHQIPAATWTFNTWVIGASGTQALTYRVYKRSSGGTETQLFTVDSTAIATGAPPPLVVKTTTSAQSAFDLDTTDILVVKIFAKRSGGLGGALVTMYYDGSTYLSNFTITPTTPYLYVVDGGTSQQVKKYNFSGTSISTLGDAGGYDNGPAVSNTRFMFEQDAIWPYSTTRAYRPFILPVIDDSFWVMDVGNERLQHYDSSNTYIERIAWMINSYIVDGVVTDPTRVFNKVNEYDVPLDTPEDAQTPVYNWGFQMTTDYFDQWPGGYRQIVEYPNGETYMLLNKPVDGVYELVRLDTSTGMVFTGVVTETDYGTRVYIDPVTGDWYKIDTTGSVGDPVLFQKRTVTGYSGGGLIPTLSAWATITTSPNIAANTTTVDASFDILGAYAVKMDSGDFAIYNEGKVNKGFHANTIATGGSAWKNQFLRATYQGAGAADNWGVPDGYFGGFPSQGYYDIANAIQYGGSKLLYNDGVILTIYRGEFWHYTQTNGLQLFDEATGMQIHYFGTTADNCREYNTDYNYGAQAMPYMVGNAFQGLFVRVGNTLYFRQNDESYHSSITCWKITGMDTVSVVNATLGGTLVPDGYVYLLGDLPSWSVVTSVGNITRSPNSEYYNVPSSDNWYNCISSHYSYLPGTNDVSIRGRSTLGQEFTFDFDIPASPVVSSEFTVKTTITFVGAFPTNTTNGMQFQILDDTDKVIARLKPQSINGFPYPAFRVDMNGDDSMFTLYGYDYQYGSWFRDGVEVFIRVHSGGCDFTWGDETPLLNLPLYDPTADRFAPAKIRALIVTTDGLDDWAQDNLLVINNLEIKVE